MGVRVEGGRQVGNGGASGWQEQVSNGGHEWRARTGRRVAEAGTWCAINGRH